MTMKSCSKCPKSNVIKKIGIITINEGYNFFILNIYIFKLKYLNYI